MAEVLKEEQFCSCGREFSENGFYLEVGKVPISFKKIGENTNPISLSLGKTFRACCSECVGNGIKKRLEKHYALEGR